MRKLPYAVACLAFLLTACRAPTRTPTPPAGIQPIFTFPDDRSWGGALWSPDARELALTTFDPQNGKGQIYLVNLETRSARSLVGPGYVGAQAWSPDGRNLSYNQGKEIWIVPVDGSAAPKPLATGFIAAWSPHGEEMAVFDSSGTSGHFTYVLKVLNLETRAERVLLSIDAASPDILDLSWSPDNSRLAFSQSTLGPEGASIERNLYFYDLPTGKLSQFTSGGENLMPTWSPDGKRIAYLHVPSDTAYASIVISQVDGSCQIDVPGINDVGSLAWSPNGSHLAYTMDSGLYSLDLAAAFGDDFVTSGPTCSPTMQGTATP